MKKLECEKMLLSNNARKRRGVPLRRKKDRRKRYFTRKECDETIKAFLEYCDGVIIW